ncbi:MAG: primary-amine oxidase [Bradyrhizobium sp.]|nr:primary-amine oxidase [Bradyrhizobium sp.]
MPSREQHARRSHPLEPLSAAEIRAAIDIVRAHPAFAHGALFETIELLEPSRAAVAAWKTGGAPPPREARANLFRNTEHGVWRLTISIEKGAVLTSAFVEGARPMIQLEQFVLVEQLVRDDPRFVAACAARGITDMSLVCVDPWSAGSSDLPDETGLHLCHVFCWLRARENDNLYAHPIEGLNAVVDLKAGAVVRVDDYGIVPIPMGEVNYDSRLRTSFRAELKPLNVVQPEGASFRLDGHKLSWDLWSAVIGFNAREGLTLHDITYDGRPLFHRASLCEMVVPYGSPFSAHHRKNVFDIGEYGIGKLANSLKLGCDCLGHIAYLDAELNTMDGEAVKIERAICIHEEDSGLLWKHWDFRTDRAEIRRGRRLVISFIATVGNYEYASYWYFKQDGEIEYEMKATGIINTVGCLPGEPSKYGVEVAPGVEGQIHQHAFCVRLEPALDGDNNSVVECDTHVEDDDANPYGNAFYVRETLLQTERDGCRKADPATMRYWRVINPEKTNRVGKPVGYKLAPSNVITPFLKANGPSGRRSAFMRNHLWVTAYDPEQRYPAGEYMNRSSGADGLIKYVAQDRPIANRPIVLWHVFGLHHLPRPEDFPVQPCITTGFKLMPSGFFDVNPGIDLPPNVNMASRLHGASASSCCGNASAG